MTIGLPQSLIAAHSQYGVFHHHTMRLLAKAVLWAMSSGGRGLSFPLGRCLSAPRGFLRGVKPNFWGWRVAMAMPTYAKSPSPDTPGGNRSNSLESLSNVRSLVGPRTLSA